MRTTYAELNLGKEFQYVGIQLEFVAKQSALSELVHQLIECKLIAVNTVTSKYCLI